MTFGRKDVPITRPDGGANVFGLAEFLCDDDLVSHDGLVWKNRFDSCVREHIVNTLAMQRGF